MGRKKNINTESASFNPPKKEERQKSNFEEFITKLMGKVILTKKGFFGLDVQKIVIIVTPSFKIAAVVSSPKKWVEQLPQKKTDELDPSTIINWAEENGFEITFSAVTPKLKSKLYDSFGDVIVSDNITESVIDLGLPDFVEQWAIENPDKFKSNINEIKKLLS